MAERLALPTSDHGFAGSNPAGGEIPPEPNRRFIAQSLSCSSSHRLEMTEILLKGRKTLTHPPSMLNSFQSYRTEMVYKLRKRQKIKIYSLNEFYYELFIVGPLRSA